ncbi:uncharacterized protein LOC111635875 [Centruroides sculpturatus]|uniref:uncharacterized protein LOC111635875 n=1 Tax=Centruroides sculpturatus TaxID=218467 RepID=UPI000C6EBA3F|nr:uncharacterized protein LOC111635875 [Centruroides sculpturatus]
MDSLSRTITEWPCKQLPVTVVFVAFILSSLSRCNPISTCVEEEVLVRNQAFKDRIIDTYNRKFYILSQTTEEQLESWRNETLNILLANIQQQRSVAETIINEMTRREFCSSSDYGNLSNTPTTDSLLNLAKDAALLKLHISLVKHSSNVFFTNQQVKPLIQEDSDTINSNSNEKIEQLAANLLESAHTLQNVIKTINNETNFTEMLNSALDQSLTKHCSPSKKFLRLCQTVKSSYKLLQTVSDYVKGNFVL